jgi:diacylglycerol O-acyltransferase
LSRIAPLGDLARLLSELAQPTEKLPYNILCRGPQTFEWTELPMAEIDAVRQACGATVNEVVLTVLCGALRRYAELHDLKVKGRKLRIVIPVNVRTQGQISSAGNQITFLPVDIPLNAREPRKLLALVQDRVKFSKTAHGAELIGMTAMLLAATPPPLQSLFGTILSQLPISVCNSICTNIPGPRTPLYLLGHKMVAAYPCVPIGGEMGMNCAVLSYNGTLFVGFTGDAQAIPDIASLSEFFPASFAELRNAIDVPAPKREAAKNHAASNQASKSEAPKSKRPRRKTRVPAGASLQVPQPAADGASGSSETAPGELLKEAASA